MRIRRTPLAAATTATLLVALVVATAPAHARWKFHDDTVGEAMVAPPGGSRATTCTDRLRAVAGWSQYFDVEGGEDPASFAVPDSALTRVRYRVWKAPAGFNSFESAQDFETGTPVFVDADGDEHPATLVGSVLTPARRPVNSPRPAGGELGQNDQYVFTTAPISVSLSGVRPGDLLGLAPASPNGIYTEVRAMSCRLPVLDARADLRPGEPQNAVRPNAPTDLVPVRVFGSRRLQVRDITSVRLGEAAPVAVRAPRDVDRDGRADRVYVFPQGDTGIQCLDTGARVTGRSRDGVRFDTREPLLVEGCAG